MAHPVGKDMQLMWRLTAEMNAKRKAVADSDDGESETEEERMQWHRVNVQAQLSSSSESEQEEDDDEVESVKEDDDEVESVKEDDDEVVEVPPPETPRIIPMRFKHEREFPTVTQKGFLTPFFSKLDEPADLTKLRMRVEVREPFAGIFQLFITLHNQVTERTMPIGFIQLTLSSAPYHLKLDYFYNLLVATDMQDNYVIHVDKSSLFAMKRLTGGEVSKFMIPVLRSFVAMSIIPSMDGWFAEDAKFDLDAYGVRDGKNKDEQDDLVKFYACLGFQSHYDPEMEAFLPAIVSMRCSSLEHFLTQSAYMDSGKWSVDFSSFRSNKNQPWHTDVYCKQSDGRATLSIK